jgi:hypothetical protein
MTVFGAEHFCLKLDTRGQDGERLSLCLQWNREQRERGCSCSIGMQLRERMGGNIRSPNPPNED